MDDGWIMDGSWISQVISQSLLSDLAVVLGVGGDHVLAGLSTSSLQFLRLGGARNPASETKQRRKTASKRPSNSGLEWHRVSVYRALDPRVVVEGHHAAPLAVRKHGAVGLACRHQKPQTVA